MWVCRRLIDCKCVLHTQTQQHIHTTGNYTIARYKTQSKIQLNVAVKATKCIPKCRNLKGNSVPEKWDVINKERVLIWITVFISKLQGFSS